MVSSLEKCDEFEELYHFGAPRDAESIRAIEVELDDRGQYCL